MSVVLAQQVEPDWEYDARWWLSEFVVAEAQATAARVGFGWVPSVEAPETWEELSEVFVASLVDGSPLPVATVNVSPSVFVSSEANYALRFWHDVTHVRLGKDFTFMDEMAVAAHHLGAVEAAGAAPGSTPWLLLRADTVGQNYVYAMTNGGFVTNQLAFAHLALTTSLPLAVVRAVQDIEGREITGRDTEALLQLMETVS